MVSTMQLSDSGHSVEEPQGKLPTLLEHSRGCVTQDILNDSHRHPHKTNLRSSASSLARKVPKIAS